MTRPVTREDLRGKIQTVLGPIAPETLGRTLMHEHVLCDIRPPGTRSDNDLGPEITLENVWQMNYGRGIKRAGRKYMLDLENIALREVEMMKNDGGDAMVELTCGGLSPDPAGLRRISEGTGVHLIMGCGYCQLVDHLVGRLVRALRLGGPPRGSEHGVAVLGP